MQALFIKFQTLLSHFHPLVKGILRFGTSVILGLYLSAGICRLLAGTAGDGDKMLRVSTELLLCGKETVGVVFIGALVLQLFLTAYVYDFGQDVFKK